MERDQNNHVDNVHDDKVDHKMGRDFRNLGSHAGMVHLHSGIEHLNNVDVEVWFAALYLLTFVLLCMLCDCMTLRYFVSGKASKRCPWFFRLGTVVGTVCGLWRQS